jgi:hypothetical protein
MQEAAKRLVVEFRRLDALGISNFYRRQYAILSPKHIIDAPMQVMLASKSTTIRYRRKQFLHILW